MKLLLFATAVLGLFLIINVYISRRFIQKLHLQQKYRDALKIFLVINYLGILGYMLARYMPIVPNWLFFLLSLPIGVLFLLFCTAVIYDISESILGKIPTTPSRREFFKKALDYSSLGIAFAMSTRSIYEAKFVQLQEVDVRIKNLKKEYNIIQLSDVHIGGLIDAGFIKELVVRINALKPDLVVITGDLVDIQIAHAMDALKELQNLQSTYGTYFVVGNHEYFHDIKEIIVTLKSLGIRVLENESVRIGEADASFYLIGVYDVFGYRINDYMPDLVHAMKDIRDDAPRILLAHQPRYIEEAQYYDIDLMLSGHTHGGQLYPFRTLVKLQQPYIDGLHQHNERTQIYVSKGTGFLGPPMRLGATREITLLHLLPS